MGYPRVCLSHNTFGQADPIKEGLRPTARANTQTKFSSLGPIKVNNFISDHNEQALKKKYKYKISK